MEGSDPLIIKGIRISPEVLKMDSIQRCGDSRCGAICCSGGVWCRDDEPPRILEWKEAIKARIPAERHDESMWFEEGDGELGTNSVDDPDRPGKTCCVFLQPDKKCALQVISIENNLGWPGIKPFYCCVYPLLIEDGVLMLDDETPLLYEGGLCQQPCTRGQAPYELLRDETILLLGEDGYRELCEKAKK
jgi:hypothetical protein